MSLSQKYRLSPHLKIYDASALYRFREDSAYLSDKYVCKTLLDNKYYIINSVIKEFLTFFSSPLTFDAVVNLFIKHFALEENKEVFNRINKFFESMVKRGIIETFLDSGKDKLDKNWIPSKYTITAQIDKDGFICIDKTNNLEVFLKYYPEFHRKNNIESWYKLLDKLDSKRVVKPKKSNENIFPGYIVFDKVNYPTLHNYLLENSLNLSHKIIIIKNLIRLVSDFHKNNIVHGDISETNILINDNLELFAIDLVTIQDINEDILINSGTPDSLPPEKLSLNSFDLLLEKKNNFRSDVYQLGTLIYKILYGTPPIICSTWKGQYYYKRNIQVKVNSNLPDGETIPTELLKIISKSLEIEPEKRFFDCSQINKLINQF